MERKFNIYGKPLPNKSDLKMLSILDRIIKKRLVWYIESELNDMIEDNDLLLTSYLEQFYTDEISKMIIDDIGNFKIKDRENTPLYYLFLKKSMEYFFKNANYTSLKNNYNKGSWSLGWVPDVDNVLGGGFEESYALVLLWLNNELKNFGTTIPAIESAINENKIKNLIKKILKEQIVNNEHSICGILSCNKLDEVLNKINHNKLTPSQIERLNKIISNYKRDVNNNLKDVPKNGGLKGATGDSEKDFCNEYLSQIQTLICEPTQE